MPRALVTLLLLPLLFAGCLGGPPAADAPLTGSTDAPQLGTADDAAAAGPADEKQPAPPEAELPEAEGSFVAITMAPHPTGRCPGAGLLLAPTPSEGAYVDFELPADTTAASFVLEEERGATGGNGYRLCAFQADTLVGEAAGVAPLELAFEAAEGPLTLVVAVQAFPDAAVNLDAQVRWSLRGVAVLGLSVPAP